MEITITQDSTIPLRVQLLNQLRHLILSEEWSPGHRIPSETELKRQLQISRSTIRQALSIAETEGLIERIPGKGTFVAHPPVSEKLQHLIGYIAGIGTNDYQYQMLLGSERGAKDKGYRVLFSVWNLPEEEYKLIDELLIDQVAGILIWPMLDDNLYRRLVRLSTRDQIPSVLLDRTFPDLQCDYVTSDNYAGAYAATKHLVKQGHRRIVFLGRPLMQLETISERWRGYNDMLKDAGLAAPEPWLVGLENEEMTYEYALQAYGDDKVNEEVEQIVRRMKKTPRPTAIFAMHDQMALLALKAARLAGLRIPDDISVIGFDDVDFTLHLETPLTTVAQNSFAIGQRAAEMLIERIEGYDGPPRQEIVATQLIVRDSTAPTATSRNAEKQGGLQPNDRASLGNTGAV